MENQLITNQREPKNLSTALEKLQGPEKEICKRKYVSRTYGSMSADDRFMAANRLLVILHAITGWLLPTGELLKVLVDQLSKKLAEGYKNFNHAEIEYAFRNNSTVKDWGKSMNIHLIDEVMDAYKQQRSIVDRVESQTYAALTLSDIQENLKVSDDDYLNSVYSVWSRSHDTALIPKLAYDILNKRKIFDLKFKLTVMSDLAREGFRDKESAAEFNSRCQVECVRRWLISLESEDILKTNNYDREKRNQSEDKADDHDRGNDTSVA